MTQRLARLAAIGLLTIVFLAGGQRAALASPSARVGASVSQSIPLPQAGALAPANPKLAATGIITNVAPIDMAQAMGINPSDVISATYRGSDPRAFGVGTSPLGGFPTDGSTFAIMSAGLAASAYLTNSAQNLSQILTGLNNSDGEDLVQLELFLQVPAGITCATFDFAYLSEEFPEFVGTQYNDVFTAELGGTNMTISGTEVIAPLNYAHDRFGNPISVNAVFGVTLTPNGGLPTYDGETEVLQASTPVTPSTTIDLVLSVQDLGDSIYDSATFLDKFVWSTNPDCRGGVVTLNTPLFLPLVRR
jgi:hypothetical protein